MDIREKRSSSMLSNAKKLDTTMQNTSKYFEDKYTSLLKYIILKPEGNWVRRNKLSFILI